MMRYSMLVYLTRMSRTLLDAGRYLRTGPERTTAEELLVGGAQMLDQIREVLEEHREDLLSQAPLDQLRGIEQSWQAQSAGLEEALETFIPCLQETVRYQVRAVFFAGLGSSWDAMHSVYAYMRDDPRFDPVVVLIPILRQIEEKGETIQDVIYEDYLTPMGIPFLPYTQYDLEEDCPDLAFLNQPYEANTITEFWPATIAKHTRLVYLPYYLPDMVEGDTCKILCLQPVHRHAWKVICSNEKAYRYYCRYAPNGGANGLLTGLPKLDPLTALPAQGIALPNGWEGIQGKTVFLWNTWYIMKYSALRWFEQITAWFEAHEDCALIWRPHPMTDTITKLYHAKEYPNYLAYRKRIEAMPNAVYDQSISCEASFYYSHAMISDYSSLQPQYLLMDKPVLWVRNNIWRFTGEAFIDSSWMEQTETETGVTDFLSHISAGGEDRRAALRKTIRQRDLPLADGRAGERVCEALWQALHQEDLTKGAVSQ